MKLIHVKPGQVKVPELRVRAQFDQETLEQFQASVKETGIVAPIIVCKVGEDLVLVDGAHRLEEAIANGLPAIDAAVFEGEMVDVLTKNLFLDHMRGKTPVAEMVKLIKALYSDYGLDPDKIREKTGLTRDYIEKLIRISQASTSVLQALDEGVIGVGHAYELSRLPHPLQQEEIIAKHQVWRFTVKELHEQIDQVLDAMEEAKQNPTPPAPAREKPAVEYRCEGCHKNVDPRYLRPVMVCPDCFGVVWKLGQEHETAAEEAATDLGGA